jgi:hypothetical protein
MKSLLNLGFNSLMSRRIRRIEKIRQAPFELQDKIFRYLLSKAKQTRWAEPLRLKDVQDYAAFARRVPLSDYESIYPWIERHLKGESGVLWPDRLVGFSKSSGTTNARSKYIPVSYQSLYQTHYTGGKDLIAIHLQHHPNSKMFTHPNFAVGGSLQANHFGGGLQIGDVSALIMNNLPSWAQWMRTPSLEVALLNDWETKIQKMVQTIAKQDVVSMQGVPTWILVILERLLAYTGKKTVAEVWPSFETFFHGAVAFEPYRQTFKNLIQSPKLKFIEIYNASEGFFGAQDEYCRESEMLLMLDHGIFYEFIPLEEIEKPNPKVLQLGEVQTGKNYALVISTNSGLWRYKIGDTIRFTSVSPFRFKITGRTKHFINAFGEEVIIENAEQALTQACKATRAKVIEFTAAPRYLEAGKKGGHEWVIEFENEPDDWTVFIDQLDSTLRNINSDYDAKRTLELALLKPVVHSAPRGTFYRWLKSKGKLGGQHKVPRLSNNRELIEEILNLAKVHSL